MPAIRSKLVLALAVLLAAAPAVADTVITAYEVISCSVVSADTHLVRLKLPRGSVRMLSALDIYEIRLSDSVRVAELAVQLPRLRVTRDSGQAVAPPAIRVQEMLRLRLERSREARSSGLASYGDFLDTLALGASQNEMVARCWEMDAVLREIGRSDKTVVELLQDVQREEEALRRRGPLTVTWLACGPVGAMLGGSIGCLAGNRIDPPTHVQRPRFPGDGCDPGGGPCGALVGCAAGSVISMAIGRSMEEAALVRRHRSHVNDLVRRVNRAVASAP